MGILGKGGSSKVYSVLDPGKRSILALKRVTLAGADEETVQSYKNEVELLKHLSGHDRIIQLVDDQVTMNAAGTKPKTLTVVSDSSLQEFRKSGTDQDDYIRLLQVMECGETDFATLLDEQRGRPLNMSFVALYWEQVRLC